MRPASRSAAWRDGSRPRAGLVIGAIAVAAGLVLALSLSHGQDGAPLLQARNAAAVGTASRPPAPAIPRTAAQLRYLAPGGSDSGPGTRRRPWRTLGRAISASKPGTTVVVRRGVYGSRGAYTEFARSGAAAAPITFVGRQRPKVLGAVIVSGDHVRLRGLVFDGPTGRVRDDREGNQIEIYGDNVEIAKCEVRNSRHHAGIYLEDAENVRLVGNYIHDNGDFGNPSQANLDHGIYFGSGSGVIANNVIEHNYAFGVHLYPRPHDVLVTHNTIVGNGRSGVIVATDSTNNRVVNNIIAHNLQNAVRAYELAGAGNVIENNLLWASGEGDVSATSRDGAALLGNRSADPRFRSSADYRLKRDSPALGWATSNGRVGRDFRGVLRPSIDSDIGAFERR